MKTVAVLSLLALEALASLAPKVVPINYTKRRNPAAPSGLQRRSRFSKRADTINVALGNAEILYYANVTVGTPGQFVQLQLDTGSSDVWMTASNASFCKQNSENCEGGTFDPSSSSTYDGLSTVFNITYVDGSSSVGKYFTDDFTIGGVSLTGVEMGLATETTIGTGIIGVSFAADEAVCSDVYTCNEYPTIVQDMVSQGKINSQAYSLWLDDLEALTGSILFGGVDSAKYTGSLVALPILKDADSGTYTSFSIELTSITSGSTDYTGSSYSAPVILDSGTTLTLLPDDIFQTIANDLDVTYDQNEDVYIAPCSKGSGSTTYDFQFGGSSGATIKVPINEFFLQVSDTICEFGIEPAGEDPILFGDTFLRSAYVVYDLANKQISLAQTNFNSTTSNVQAIESGADGVPSVSSTASAATISQTASVSSYGVVSVTATDGFATATTSATATAGASAISIPLMDVGGIVTMALSSMFALLGSCIIFL